MGFSSFTMLSPLSSPRTFSFFHRRKSLPTLHFPLSLETTHLLFVSMNLPIVEILCEWDHLL